MQEEKHSDSAHFVTLTYTTTTVPITQRGFMTLCKADVQKFFKRLRKMLPDNKIKYYVAGEYGDKSMRPHYHAIIFNADVVSIDKAWSLDNKSLGQTHFGTVTGASVGYTLKYMSKAKKIPMHRNDDRVKEFSLMSKGLGASYMSDAMVQWHKNDLENRMYLNLEEGKKISMPRYYKDKVYTEPERERVAFFARLKNELRDRDLLRKMEEKYGDDYVRLKVTADHAAFEKMYRDAEKDRNKI